MFVALIGLTVAQTNGTNHDMSSEKTIAVFANIEPNKSSKIVLKSHIFIDEHEPALRYERREFSERVDALIFLIQYFIFCVEFFENKLNSLDKELFEKDPRRKQRYASEKRADLYNKKAKKKFIRKNSRRAGRNCYIATDIRSDEARQICREICLAADVEFLPWSELRKEFGS